MTVKRLTVATQKSYLYSVECYAKYYEALKDLVKYTGAWKGADKLVFEIIASHLKHLKSPIKCIEVTGCSYTKKGINGRVSLNMNYDYFLLNADSSTYLFEIGADD